MPDFGTQPLNYQIDVASPFQSAMAGYQSGAAIRNDQQAQVQQQQQAAAQQQSQQMLSALANNPNATASDYSRAMTAIPSVAEQLGKAWSVKNTAQQQQTLSDALQWGSAIKSGEKQIAVDMMNSRADAMERAVGAPSPDSQAIRTVAAMTLAHPEFALGQIQALVAHYPDGDKAANALRALGDETRAEQQAPADLAKKNAEALKATADSTVAQSTVPAQIAKPTLENYNISSQIANRAGQLALDQDKLSSEYSLKVAELRRKPGAIDLPDSALKIVNESAGNAVLARNSAAQLNDLASQFETADPNSFGASAWEFAKQATGQQDYVSALRKEYVRLRAGEVAKILPPGPASDTDVKNAMAGFPPDTASASQVSSFLRGTAKLQAYNAQIEDAKSEWANAVGQLGKAPRDIEIGGVSVPAGTTFSEFTKRTLKPIGAVTQRPAAATGAKARLLQIYGGTSSAPVPSPGTD